MNTKKLIVFFFCAAFIATLSAEQITRFAVVDTSRIYTTFYRDSRNIRDYEAKNTQFKSEIQRMGEEIKSLRQQKVDTDPVKDPSRFQRLEAEITSKTNMLLEYQKIKNAELDTLKKKLTNDDDFYSMLYDVIKKTAEEDGCSIVLSLQDNNSIFWYNSSVDITDKVILKMTSGQQ